MLLKKRITKVQWAYLAGMIDGEGSITVLNRKQESHRRWKPTWHAYQTRIIIFNTCKEVISWIGEVFSGENSIHANVCEDRTNRKRTVYRVHWQSYESIITVLTGVLPYLKIKKPQADLLLEYCQIRLSRPTHKSKLSEREEEIHTLIAGLNKK